MALATSIVPRAPISWRARNAAYHAAVLRTTHHAQPADPATVRAIALQAIDAAKSAGASYADVRLTRIVSENFSGAGFISDGEQYGIGVRALVNGGWGFAASPNWTRDEAVRLARAAAAEAKINAQADPEHVDMGQYPIVTGSWGTPIRIDPFQLSLEEKMDFGHSLDGLYPMHEPGWSIGGSGGGIMFVRIERAIATTDGSYVTQTLYESQGMFSISVEKTKDGMPTGETRNTSARGLDRAGAGWELILDANIRDQIPQLIDEAKALFLSPPTKPVDIGRYEVVCDAGTLASLVSATLGNATQLDRCLGYEANAGGTSYLGPDPVARLGTSFGSPLLTVHGDRSMPKGLATVKWDDEGVEPNAFAIVDNGILVDYQTTREQAAWLTNWYTKQGQPIRSHGCALGMSALKVPLQRTPNLSILPGQASITFDDLVANTKRGIALTNAGVRMDFQSRDGTLVGTMREIINGKLGAFIDGGGILFDSTEIWKKLHALGGPSSRGQFPSANVKGEPAAIAGFSVAAVPGSFKDLAVVDMRRKA
jgi:TldD protein